MHDFARFEADVVGVQELLVVAGQSVVVGVDMPVVGRIVGANRRVPYMAIAVELDRTILTEIALESPAAFAPHPLERTLFVEDADDAARDCAMRLLRLVDTPGAIALLHQGILRELHFWLLSGRHQVALRALAMPDSYASRAIADLRANFREELSPERLARAAAMGVSAFHQHFKKMT